MTNQSILVIAGNHTRRRFTDPIRVLQTKSNCNKLVKLPINQ